MPQYFRVIAAAGRGLDSGESPLEDWAVEKRGAKPACGSTGNSVDDNHPSSDSATLQPLLKSNLCLVVFEGENSIWAKVNSYVCRKGLIVEKVMVKNTKGCENVALNAVCCAYTNFLMNYSAFFFFAAVKKKKSKHAQLVHNKVVDHCAVSFSSNESENCEVGSPICCENLSKDLQLSALGDASQEQTWQRRRLFSGTLPSTHIYVGETQTARQTELAEKKKKKRKPPRMASPCHS